MSRQRHQIGHLKMCSLGSTYGSWVANAAVLKLSMGAASSTASSVPDTALAMAARMQRESLQD